MRISVSLDQVTALTEAMRISETGFAFVMLFFLLRVKEFGALSLILNRRHLRGPDVRGIAKPTPETRRKDDCCRRTRLVVLCRLAVIANADLSKLSEV